MARPQQDAIDTFVSITGASEAVALQKLEEHGGDLNEAVNAHFNEGDRIIRHPASVPALQNSFGRNFFDGGGATEFTSHAFWVSHPREVREIPIEFTDGNDQSGHSGPGPTIEDASGSAYAHEPEIHGNVIIDGDEDEDLPVAPTANERKDGFSGDYIEGRRPGPSVHQSDNATHYGNDIEEEMLQAAIEASKREVVEGYPNQPFDILNDLSGPPLVQRPSHLEDVQLARAVSVSLETAGQVEALREQVEQVGPAEQRIFNSSVIEVAADGRQGFGSPNNGSARQFKLEIGNSSIQEEAEDVEEQPLVRHRSRRFASEATESEKDVGRVDHLPSSPGQRDITSHIQQNGDAFHSDEWGGISSDEHDEAVMLEAALFGGIPEGTTYRFAYPSDRVLQTGSDRNAGLYPQRAPHPPSPTLAAQRLLREQQDDEYLASLQADREKELKATEESEIRCLEEVAAREAALEEERHREEEAHRRLLEEEEFERQLAAKQAALPQEPTLDDGSAVTLLVRMPDGSRRGRRFLKSDKLQSLFDFIDVGRGVKPGTYKLVRPYPRHAFGNGESGLTLSELGLTSKQEALFLELI
eukprot:TRINITY_DN2827_c0_g2_i1.p1 TRINITY_DN2827_c0_g2~~TRINITY_DN2827_c0_g2_i1.p1  ORF type:complete len:585 (+),score=155.30 TRINITY_DN2827_c0_g2_i1:82-1836(+)